MEQNVKGANKIEFLLEVDDLDECKQFIEEYKETNTNGIYEMQIIDSINGQIVWEK